MINVLADLYYPLISVCVFMEMSVVIIFVLITMLLTDQSCCALTLIDIE